MIPSQPAATPASGTPSPVPAPVPAQSGALTGVNVIVMGPAGTGKTYSIGTLVDTGIDVFYLSLESGMETLLGYWSDRGLPIPPNLHWHRLDAPKASFLELIDNAKKINMLSLDSLAKMQDPNRSKHNQFVELLMALNNFHDDRTGLVFGPVDKWGTDKVLVIDGLTGISKASMAMVVGGKPVRSQSDWGIAQDQVDKILTMLCDNCPCHFVLIAHVERETDQVLGGVKLMVSTLGRALPPKIPILFSDVILAVRNGTKWNWDTANAQADLKTRNLPVRSDNPPDFAAIMSKWSSRNQSTSVPA